MFIYESMNYKIKSSLYYTHSVIVVRFSMPCFRYVINICSWWRKSSGNYFYSQYFYCVDFAYSYLMLDVFESAVERSGQK